MLDFLKKDGEKKVEYIELIYDLIFVYIIGRNNSILHTFRNGFIAPSAMLTYILSALIILQVWYTTVIYINKYGSNSIQDKLMIFVNMYLLYYMAEGMRSDWQGFFWQYNIAWALILLNFLINFTVVYKRVSREAPWVCASIKNNIIVIAVQLAIILVSFPLYHITNIPFTPVAMAVGMIMSALSKKSNSLVASDFAHLTERIMLFVVFTFGEMIIAIAGYFEGGFSLNTLYFSLMGFLIVAGLFLSYGYIYDNVIDREQPTTGMAYMLLHVFLITSLNFITAALKFMRMEEVSAIPKNIFIVASFVAYFIFLFATEPWAKMRCRAHLKFYIVIIAASLVFAGLMAAFYKNSYVSIALSAVYIYSIFIYLIINVKKSQEVSAQE